MLRLFSFPGTLILLSALPAVQASVLPAESPNAYSVEVESHALWQARNDVAIPGDSGTRFSLKDVLSSPVFGVRIEPTYTFSDRHQLRGVFAPLTIQDRGKLMIPVRFQATTFAINQETEATYRFNSYRLTYRYLFVSQSDWSVLGGITLKVRDATISLRQGSAFEEKSNLGFVPLLHGAVARRLGSGWQAELELDALAAPQGRAEDIRLGMRKTFFESGWSVAGGYRLLEGGADNKTVFTFSTYHYAFLSLGLMF